MSNKVIKIACRGADSKELDELIGFQDKLKTISKPNLKKLKDSIIKLGFSAPVFIWKHDSENKIIDGHSRTRALRELRDEGYYIPLIPVVFIEAKTKIEAKKKLLHITSAYGEFNSEGFKDFSSSFEESDFKNIEIAKFKKEKKIYKKKEKEKKICPHCGNEL